MTKANLMDMQRQATRTGIGLRFDHHERVVAERPAVAWWEVHSENFFGDGGRPLQVLEAVAEDYPLSFHGVGLSMGSVDPLDREHLRHLKRLVERFQPALVSEHVAWSSVDGVFYNDLLPLPYTEEALALLVQRVDQVQDILGRPLLMENPSTYLRYVDSPIPEQEFLVELARRSGCGLLLDVNNVYVNASNHGFDAHRYLDAIPGGLVGEIHLAGHTVNNFDGGSIVIDTHNARVVEPVWELFAHTVRRIGPKPTLIEWDSDLPELEVLMDEAQLADGYLEETPHALAS